MSITFFCNVITLIDQFQGYIFGKWGRLLRRLVWFSTDLYLLGGRFVKEKWRQIDGLHIFSCHPIKCYEIILSLNRNCKCSNSSCTSMEISALQHQIHLVNHYYYIVRQARHCNLRIQNYQKVLKSL